MPLGLIAMKWDKRSGTEIAAKYPEEMTISDKTQMQVISAHEYSGESGMISLMVGSLNIASYYTGSEEGFYVVLLLQIDDDADAYEGAMPDASRRLYKAYNEDSLQDIIASVYQRLSIFPTLNEEQMLAMTYEDEIKRLIIQRLREECVISKSELMVWLKDAHKHGFVDVDGLIIDLIKRDLIKETSVKGMPSELIFLTHDVMMARLPAVEILKNPAERGIPEVLASDYILECTKFFQNYRPSEEDNLSIITLLIDPQIYEVIRLLRTAIVMKNDLQKLKKKGVENVDSVLKILWEAKMIQVFQDSQGNEYYALLSDFIIERVFPKYILRIVKSNYENKSKSDKVLIEYLNVLEDTYLNFRTKRKAKTED